MLKARDLVKNFGYFNVVDHLSFNVEKGQIYGLAGAQGAGKTTLMKIVAGVLMPDSGSVELNGINMLDDPQGIKGKIGYMPESPGFYDELRVYEYMDFYSGIYGIPKAERLGIIDMLLELVELSNKKDVYVGALTRSMKKWLSLARSLIHNPELLIFDDLASGLEPEEWNELKEMLKTLRDMGKTILVSSRNLSKLARLCTCIGIIEYGKIVISGTFDEISNNVNMKRISRII
jgi:ABC-2 type transport system ATP-binding protein